MSKRSRTPRPNKPSRRDEGGFFRPFANIPVADSEPTSPSPSKQISHPKPPSPKDSPPVDDALTFERLLAGVTPLDQKGSRRIPTSGSDSPTQTNHLADAVAQHQRQEDAARERLRLLVEEASRFEVLDDGRQIEGRRRGVDGGLVRRMRLGELPVDATLDLHGMRTDEARDAVERFVRDRRLKSDRHVLIVHGKGHNSPRGVSVLRGEVAAWLSEGQASIHVAAFVTAPSELGGQGALCVLLASQVDSARRV